MLYSYQAKDSTGRTVTGALDAPDERRAAQEIRDMGYFPMRLAPQGGAGATLAPPLGQSPRAASSQAISPGRWLLAHLVFPLWSGVGLRDLALLYRQFATMIGAGVPIYQCLSSLQQQTSNGALRGCLRRVAARVLAGDKLTAAMGEFPWVFTDFHRAMIGAGEATGRLDVMLNRLSAALEQEYALRGAIKKEIWYPAFTLVASFLLPPIVDLVVFNNARMYFQDAIQPLLVAAGVILGIYVTTRLLSQFKAAYDWLIASLPGIGGTVRMIALARFCRSLSSLYAAGLSFPDCLRAAAQATGNVYLAGRMMTAIPALQGGRGMAEALIATRIFPPMVMSMLGTGEQTGSVDATMDKVAEYYEEESAARLHRLSATLGALAMVIVGYRVLLVLGKFYGGQAQQIDDLRKDIDQQ